ncbi:MAG: FixH family protein [Solirubrobacterales bacterium]
MAQARKPGWWYPYIFVGAFVVVVAVNGALAYFATSTFTGLETEGAYDKGLAYNKNLALARAQADLGWTVDTNVDPVSGGFARADVSIRYRDRDGKPVEGMEVKAHLVRPTAKGYDHDVTLPARGDGTYGAVFDLPLKGVWVMDVTALGSDVSYQHEKRFVLP